MLLNFTEAELGITEVFLHRTGEKIGPRSTVQDENSGSLVECKVNEKGAPYVLVYVHSKCLLSFRLGFNYAFSSV